MVAHPTAEATHGTTARKIVERPHVVSVCTHRIAVGWPVYCSHVRCVKSRRKDGSWQEFPPRPRGESLRASDGEGRSSVLSALSESSARRNDSRSPRSRGSCGELSQAVAAGKAQRIWHLERETKGRETNTRTAIGQATPMLVSNTESKGDTHCTGAIEKKKNIPAQRTQEEASPR